MKRYIEFVICGKKYLLSVEAVRQDMAKWREMDASEPLDDFEILDWVNNNMDWVDVKDHVIEVPYDSPSCNKEAEFINADKKVVWKDM